MKVLFFYVFSVLFFVFAWYLIGITETRHVFRPVGYVPTVHECLSICADEFERWGC